MPRKWVDASDHYRRIEAAEVATWSEPKNKRPKRASIWNREAAALEIEAFIASKSWRDASPRHFVELYIRCHREVYGVEPLELRTKAAALACASLARKCLKENFSNDQDALADFVSWVWYRERQDERKRRSGLKTGDFRISWRYQWSAKLVTEHNRAILTQKAVEKAGKSARS